MRLRPYGMSIATSTQWCFNFVLTKVGSLRFCIATIHNR